MTDPIIPQAAGTVAVAGTEPQNPVVAALQGVEAELLQRLDQKSTRDAIVQGVFSFFSIAFPAAAPVLAKVEGVIQTLAEIGAK